jgi:hypothetical protein
MKLRNILLFSLTVLPVLLTGCSGGDSAELSDPVTRDYETYIGEFKSLGGIQVSDSITHLFEQDNGDILYAYSDRYDLDDEKYFSTKLEVYGIVMAYEKMDKDVFEVKRISLVQEDDESEELEFEMKEFKDTDLGFTISYPNTWAFNTLRDAIKLEAPLSEDAADGLEADYVVVAQTSAALLDFADEGDLTSEIQAFVAVNYAHLSGDGIVSSIGADSQFAIKYKNENGDISYFLNRADELFELSFFHPSEDSEDLLANSNMFGEIVSSFRFIPIDGELGEVEDVVDIVVEPEVVVEPVVEDEEEEEDTGPVSVAGFREFESNPYSFRILHPSNWFFAGGNGGYDFGGESFDDDDAEVLIRLDLNTKTAEGSSTSGDRFEITVLVGERYYTLNGDSTYEEAMVTMAESITEIETTDDEE